MTKAGDVVLEGAERVVSPAAAPPAKPARKFRDIVEMYMRNRLPYDIHPSFQEINRLDSTETRPALPASSQTEPAWKTTTLQDFDDDEEEENFSPEKLYQEAETEKVRFAATLKSYEEVADAKYRTNITLEGVEHTWDQVLDEVNLVACQHKDSTSFWAKIRKGLRKFGDSHCAFDAWLGLLPTQSQYCSFLCGGLKLVIRAAARLREIRESVADALAEIPILLSNTNLIQNVFKKSKELHLCSSTLYVTTLAALEHIVTWYQEKATKKGLKVLFKQEGYERTLVKKIKDVKTASDRFAEVAKICSYHKQDVLHRAVKQNRNEVQTNRLIIERSRSESAQNYTSLGHVVQNESKETRLIIAKLKSQVDDLLKCFLSSNERINPHTHDLREPMLPAKGLASQIARLKSQKQKRMRIQQEALNILDYEESVPTSDIKAILKLAWTLPKAAQDRAVSLMQSPKLHSWIRNHESSILFVNGNYNPSARQSPLSFVSAKLMDSIQPASSLDPEAVSGMFAHAFFCGQHLNSKDPDNGLGGMMRSLLAQLLVAHKNFDLSIIEKLRHIDPSDVSTLCEIYFCLIMQIPAQTVVFCIIDGLTFHEDSRTRCREAFTVIQTVLNLTKSCSGDERCIFKVLLTCPGTSRVLYKEMAKEDVVWMPRKVSAQGGFTSMKWSATAGKDVGDLVAG